MNLAELNARAANAQREIWMYADVLESRIPENFGWSASKISSFTSCNRKWWFEAIEHREKKKGKGALFGDFLHFLRERYFTTGKVPDKTTFTQEFLQEKWDILIKEKLFEGKEQKEFNKMISDAVKLASLGLHQLPHPSVIGDGVELSIEGVLKTRVGKVRGFIDFFLPDQGAVGHYPRDFDHYPDTRGVPLVGDHKTTSNARWIKSVDELLTEDPQPIIYGKYAVQRTGASFVDGLWHYNVRPSKKIIPVHFRMKKEHIDERYEYYESVAEKMLKIYSDGSCTSADVEPNYLACNNFGGCPHADYCGITNKQKMGSLIMSTDFETAIAEQQQEFQEADAAIQRSLNKALGMNTQQGATTMTTPNFLPPAQQNFQQPNPQQMPPQQQQFQQPPQQQQFQQPPQQQFQQPPQQQPQQQQQFQQQPQGFQNLQAQPAPAPAPAPASAPAPAPASAPVPETLDMPVTPPDAPPADLEITKEELDAKEQAKKPKKKMTKDEKNFRNTLLANLYINFLNRGSSLDQAADAALKAADVFLERL